MIYLVLVCTSFPEMLAIPNIIYRDRKKAKEMDQQTLRQPK